jgi:predicted esterase
VNDLGFIHRFIPAESSPRTLLLLHGTGADENDLLDLGRAIDPKAALLSPRGKVLENGAPRFFRRLAEGVFDEADVVARAHELAKFVADAADQYKIDMNNLVAVGYSNGANIAAAMMLLGAVKFPEAILFRAMVPLSRDYDRPDLKSSRILISTGEFDPIARLAIANALSDLLRQAGAAVELKVQPGGHELTPNDVATAREWLGATR